MRVLRPVFAAGVLVLLAGPVLAQSRYATVELRAGYTMGLGAAADTLKGQSSFGGSVNVALSDRMHLGLSADWAHHSRKDANGNVLGGADDPQWHTVHAFLNLSYDVISTDKVTGSLNAGPGLVMLSPNQVLRDGQGLKSDAHFGAKFGGSLTYWFTDRIGLLASPQVIMAMKKTSGQIFTDKSAMFAVLTGGFNFKI